MVHGGNDGSGLVHRGNGEPSKWCTRGLAGPV